MSLPMAKQKLTPAANGGLVSIDALRPLPLRHPANFAKPPIPVRAPSAAYGFQANVSRQIAAIANAGKPVE